MQSAIDDDDIEEKGKYLQPAFKFSDAECNALLAEAQEMEEVLAGHKVCPRVSDSEMLCPCMPLLSMAAPLTCVYTPAPSFCRIF